MSITLGGGGGGDALSVDIARGGGFNGLRGSEGSAQLRKMAHGLIDVVASVALNPLQFLPFGLDRGTGLSDPVCLVNRVTGTQGGCRGSLIGKSYPPLYPPLPQGGGYNGG